MFGMKTGIKFASRLKHEIRFDNKTDILFKGFFKTFGFKKLVSGLFEKIVLKIGVGLSFNKITSNFSTSSNLWKTWH